MKHMSCQTGKALPAVICVVLFFALSSSAVATPNDVFRLEATAGSYPVGLRVVEQYDYSRTYRPLVDDLGKLYTGERARPIQTLIWYPAELGNGAHETMSVKDYVNLWAAETSFRKPEQSLKMQQWLSATSSTLDTHLWAVRDANPAPGRFPIVAYAPGASDMSWENADLCEYLASFGYLVIASPSLGADSRSMTVDLRGANSQARDISFLLAYAKGLSNTDGSAVAVIGDSWGAMAALFAAARDNRIRALVSLDGSTRYYPGLLKLAADVHPDRMSIPLVYFMQGDYSLENRDRFGAPELRDGPNFLNSWTRGDLIVVHMLGMSHASLCSMWQRNEDYWSEYGNGPAQPGDYGRADAITGYAWVARYALEFLDTYLKHDATAKEFLKASPAENGVPKHVLTVTYRSSTRAVGSLEDFRTELGRNGFERAGEVYAEFRKRETDFTLDEGAVADWADELIGDEHLHEALALLKLNASTHPDSSRAYVKLAEAYDLLGQEQLAIYSYQKAITKDPDNEVAKRGLEKLSTRATAASESSR
jgi:dienelactone hydrolase